MSGPRHPLLEIIGERLKRAGAEVLADINESTAEVVLDHVEDAARKVHDGIRTARERVRGRRRGGYDR